MCRFVETYSSGIVSIYKNVVIDTSLVVRGSGVGRVEFCSQSGLKLLVGKYKVTFLAFYATFL